MFTTTATLPTTAVAATAIANNARTTTTTASSSHSISSMPITSSSSSFLIPQSEWNILNIMMYNNIDNNTVMNYTTNIGTNNMNNDTDNVIDVTQLSLYEIIIYLNNISVTLLGTFNNYIAAIQTMKDTLSLLHNTTTTASCSNNQNNCIYEAYTCTIHTAAQRIIYEIQKHHHQQQQQQQQQLGDNATTSSSSSSSSASSSYYTTAMNINEPKMNHIGVVVMSCYYSPNDAYYLLASIRTSKVAIYIDTNHSNNNNDYYHTNLHVIRSILVYNYGIAHRCCTTVPTTTTATTIVNNNANTNIDQFVPPDNTKIGTFCLQIFQYAEQLLLPVIQQINEQEHENQDNQMEHDQAESSSESESELLLLYRFILTRNLMMISCKLGMSLCELYKETLDPIETSIVHSNTTNTTSNNNNNNNNNDIQLGLVQQQQQHQQSNYHSSSNTLNNNSNNIVIRHNTPNIRSSSNIQQQQDDYASAA